MSLARKALQSALWLVLRFGGRQVANIGAFLFIAAMTPPAAFGAAAVATGLALLLRPLVSRGFRDAVIQAEALTPEVFDTAFWANTAWGLILALGLALASPVAAVIFGDPTIAAMTAVGSMMVFAASVGSVFEAAIEREFRHRQLTLVQAIASLSAVAVAAALLWRGHGAWAAVALSVVESVALCAAVAFVARRWPGRSVSLPELRRQLGFGGPVMISASIAGANIRLAQLIVGAFLGASATGFFRVAAQVNQLLTQLVAGPINQVLLPAFSRVRSDHGRQLARAVAAASAACAPAFIGAAAVSPLLLTLLLGEEWRVAGVVSGILCFEIFAALLGPVINPALLALGRSRQVAAVSTVGLTVSAAMVALGAQFSLELAAVLYVGRAVFTVPLTLYFANRALGLRPLAMLAPAAPYLVASLIMYAVVAFLVLPAAGRLDPVVAVGCGVFAGVLVYGALVRFGVSRIAPTAYEPLVTLAPGRVRKWLGPINR